MWLNLQEIGDLVTVTEDILNGKLCFLCSDGNYKTHSSKEGKPTHYFLAQNYAPVCMESESRFSISQKVW